MITITVTERSRSGKYVIAIDDEPIPVPATRTPFFAAARWLKAQGVADDVQIRLLHANSDVVAITSTVGHAAGMTVEERDKGSIRFTEWTPHPNSPENIRGDGC